MKSMRRSKYRVNIRLNLSVYISIYLQNISIDIYKANVCLFSLSNNNFRSSLIKSRTYIKQHQYIRTSTYL